MFNRYPTQKMGRWLFFLLWLLMVVVALVTFFTIDWRSALLALGVSSIFFIPAFVLSEKVFDRFVKTMAKVSFLAPIVRFLSG